MPRNPETSAKGCPLCGRPSSPGHKPFCGQGCKDRDLLKWLGDGYRIAGPPADETDLAGVDRGGDDS
jgi:hypothetical protein